MLAKSKRLEVWRKHFSAKNIRSLSKLNANLNQYERDNDVNHQYVLQKRRISISYLGKNYASFEDLANEKPIEDDVV